MEVSSIAKDLLQNLPPLHKVDPIKSQSYLRYCGISEHFAFHIVFPVACLVVVALNAAILDYFLIKSNQLHYMWIILDVIVLCLFMGAFFKAYPYFNERFKLSRSPPETSAVTSAVTPAGTPAGTPAVTPAVTPAGTPVGTQAGIPAGTQAGTELSCFRRFTRDLPLCYISWFVFSVVMSAKVSIIYALPNSISSQLKEHNFFGPNTLQVGISLAAVVYHLLVGAHYDVTMNLEQKSFLQRNVDGIYLDILDTTQFLDAFGEDVNVTVMYTECEKNVNLTARYDVYVYTIGQAITCFNYILPTEALYFLAYSNFAKNMQSENFQKIHVAIYFLIVNFPLFTVRMVIWLLHEQDISVFMVKNIVVIVKCIVEVFNCKFAVTDCCKNKKSKKKKLKDTQSQDSDDQFSLVHNAATPLDTLSLGYSTFALDEDIGCPNANFRGALTGPDQDDENVSSQRLQL